MTGWMGNYGDRAPARFIPASEPARLVTPGMGFQPDSAGGYGVVSVTGDRHDQVSKDAPAWFGAAINALANAGAGVAVLARKVGSSGKYNFWSIPAGVTTVAQWEAATAVLVAEADARRASAKADKVSASIGAERAAHEKLAAAHRGMVVEFHAGEIAKGASGAVRCLAVSSVLTEDGQELTIRTLRDGWDMWSQPKYSLQVLEVAA